MLTLCWSATSGDHDATWPSGSVPPRPGLLEPYDLRRQFDILRALEPTPVRAPRRSGSSRPARCSGREFYVMERLPGRVYERGVPEELAGDPERIRRMCESMVEQIAAIHAVDLRRDRARLRSSDGHGYVDRELDHWSGEIERRAQRGPLPALERLVGGVA